MLKIEPRKWIAVWYRCPVCGAQTAHTMLTPWEYKHRPAGECWKYDHRCTLEVVERRWYTTFCIEPGVSFTTIAGTLEQIGPFKICDIVQPDVRAFRKWYRQARAEADKRGREYREHERRVEAEWAARRKLLKEAEDVARAAQGGGQADEFDPFLDDLP